MQPLDGLLVVGLEVAVAAPHCTRQLADLGARVIKVESPAGDFARYYDDSVGEVSAYFAWANRGKESVALDLKSSRDRDLAERILARADVLVQNLAPGAAERLELDARSVVARHPRLVAVDISGYGTGGKRETSRAYDLLVQAEAGSCAVTGTADAPAKPGIPLADIGTGMTAANAILAALLARSQSGAGAAISVAMFDVVTDWMSWALHQARATGLDPLPLGMSSPMVSPYGAYPTADGQTIVIGTTNDAEWRRLATEVLGRPDLAGDPRYATTADRVRLRRTLMPSSPRGWGVRRSRQPVPRPRRPGSAGLGSTGRWTSSRIPNWTFAAAGRRRSRRGRNSVRYDRQPMPSPGPGNPATSPPSANTPTRSATSSVPEA